jgi:hypothetical protein
MTIIDQRIMNIPWTRVVLPANFNVRGDDVSEEELASLVESLGREGNINPISVEPEVNIDLSDTEAVARYLADQRNTFHVTDGFGRARALQILAVKLGWADDHPVTVTCCVFRNRLDPYLRNLSENVERRGLRTADLAKRCFELTEGGILEDARGGGPLPDKLSAQALADRLGKSASFVRELVRGWRGACPELREAWRSETVAADQVRAWCSKGADKQRALLAAFLAGEAPVNGKANGHAVVASEDEEEDEGGAKGRAKKKAKADKDDHKAPTRTAILEKVETYGKKLDEGKLSAGEKAVIRAKLDALRWAAGEIRRLS